MRELGGCRRDAHGVVHEASVRDPARGIGVDLGCEMREHTLVCGREGRAESAHGLARHWPAAWRDHSSGDEMARAFEPRKTICPMQP